MDFQIARAALQIDEIATEQKQPIALAGQLTGQRPSDAPGRPDEHHLHLRRLLVEVTTTPARAARSPRTRTD